MGEYADAAIWAEMNGIDPSDLTPEDWIEFCDDNKPADPAFMHGEAGMFLHYIDEWRDEDAPPSRAETLAFLFPDLAKADAEKLVAGLEALTALPEPEREDEAASND